MTQEYIKQLEEQIQALNEQIEKCNDEYKEVIQAQTEHNTYKRNIIVLMRGYIDEIQWYEGEILRYDSSHSVYIKYNEIIEEHNLYLKILFDVIAIMVWDKTYTDEIIETELNSFFDSTINGCYIKKRIPWILKWRRKFIS